MERQLARLKALSDATRLRILMALRYGWFGVNELAGIFEMGQSRISRHLRILLECDLVRARRQGNWVYYTLTEQWFAHLEGPMPGSLPILMREILEDSNRPPLNNDNAAVKACLDRRREVSGTFFDAVAADWDSRREEFHGPVHYVKRLLKQLGSGGVVVDLGTGTGVLLPPLSLHAEQVIAIDAASSMLELARRTANELHLDNVELRLGALEHLPLPDAHADAMVAHMVLHHVSNPPDALREIHRGLRDNGRCVIADLCTHNVDEFRSQLGDLWLGFDVDELHEWLEEANFSVEHSEIVPGTDGRPDIIVLAAQKKGTGRSSEPGLATSTENFSQGVHPS